MVKILSKAFFVVKVISFLGLFCLTILFVGCTKTENKTVYESSEVKGNKAPNYNGVTVTQITAYINRSYIDLIGQEASSIELSQNLTLLQANPKDSLTKDQFIKSLENKRAYYKRFFELTSAKMIQGNDSADIVSQLKNSYYQLYLLTSGKRYEPVAVTYLNYNIYYLLKLSNSVDTLWKNQIDLPNYYALFINSWFYDEINMGSENFVKALYQNLYFRTPSAEELNQGKNLYDNKVGTLFQVSGSNKSDLIKIATSTTEFYQGYIIDAYLQFLQRKPTNIELSSKLNTFLIDKDYKKIRRILLTSKEYAGF